MKSGKKLRLFFGLSWNTDPSYIMLLLANTLATGIQAVAAVVLPKFLIDELIGGQDAGRIALTGALVVGSNLFFGWLARFMKRCLAVQNPYMNQQLGKRL